MPQYTVVYFNGRGRAELIRQVFALAGEEYEDYRLKDGEWATMKPTTPFGQLPFLKIDGKVELCQSLSIARYLARKFGLAGKTELDQAKVDMTVDCAEEVTKPLPAIFKTKNEEEKAAIIKKFSEDLPGNLEKFEKMLSNSNSKSGYFVGDEITWCDLHFVGMLDAVKPFGVEVCLDKFPKIKTLQTNVQSNPRIAAWIAKRPESSF